MAAQTPPRFRYTPALDGVRAVAIGAVLAFHADESVVRGGWVGVDLFFVLSGFLITTLLIQEFNTTGTVRLRRFYARRFLRLSPALLTLLVVLLASSLVVTDQAARDIRSSVWPAALYITNWALAFEWVRGTVLPHTWSLAIEEQFYLLWPPVLVLLLRRRVAPARILAVVAAGVACAVVVRIALFEAGANSHRLKFGSDVRADTVLMGCGLAIAYTSGWITAYRRVLVPASYAACVPLLLVVATVRSTDRLVFLGGYTVIAVCCAVLTAGLLLGQDSLLSRLLSLPPLVWLGRLSYSIYLWHWPIFYASIRLSPNDAPLTRRLMVLAVALTATMVASTASYYLVEQRFLRIKDRMGASGIHADAAPRERTRVELTAA